MKIKFRENITTKQVECFVDDVKVYASDWYTTTAKWAQKTYNLTDVELYAIYDDYKKDYLLLKGE